MTERVPASHIKTLSRRHTYLDGLAEEHVNAYDIAEAAALTTAVNLMKAAKELGEDGDLEDIVFKVRTPGSHIKTLRRRLTYLENLEEDQVNAYDIAETAALTTAVTLLEEVRELKMGAPKNMEASIEGFLSQEAVTQ